MPSLVADAVGQPGIDWGSVADWFAAVGTVGTLLLALVLLMRDRTRERRRSADSFITWQSAEFYGRADGADSDVAYVIHSYNAGDAPILQAYAQYEHPETNRPEGFMLGSGHAGIAPGANHVNRTSAFGATSEPTIHVVFRDRHGTKRVRVLQTGKYLSARQAKAILAAKLTFV